MICWILPIKTVSEANSSEHWSKKAKRHKRQQFLVRYMFNKETEKIRLPCTVTLTRLSPRTLDTDNLQTSMKYIRDEISELLIPEKAGAYITRKGTVKRKKGHADNDPRISWCYAQEKWKVLAVKIQIDGD